MGGKENIVGAWKDEDLCYTVRKHVVQSKYENYVQKRIVAYGADWNQIGKKSWMF